MPSFRALKPQPQNKFGFTFYSQNYAAGICWHYQESSGCFESPPPPPPPKKKKIPTYVSVLSGCP